MPRSRPIHRLIFLTWLAAALASAQLRPNSAAEPLTSNLPIQRIGPNDLVAVSVYDAPELTRTVRVAPDGYVRLPMLQRRVLAAEKLPSELETGIAAALVAEQLIVEPFVTVTVAEYTSRPISVMGAVRHPVTFQASSPTTLLDALARAEGLTPEAGSEILVSRPQRTNGAEPAAMLRRIPVKGLIDAAAPEMNLTLVGGEEIRVPEAGKIFIVGNVKHPGAFVVRENQQPTLLKALALAEGLLPYSGKQAYIYRRESGGTTKNEIAVELKQIMARKAEDVTLMANDVLYIPEAQGKRATLAAVEKLLMFGSGATTALIYAGVR